MEKYILRRFLRHNFYVLMVCFFSLILFLAMAVGAANRGFFGLDSLINSKTYLMQNPALDNLMIFITNIASPFYLSVFSFILLGVLIYKRRIRSALLVLLGMSGGVFFESLIKLIIHRARPENALIDVTGYSFPSGHATMAAIFFSLLIYLFKDDIRNNYIRRVFIWGNVFLFLLVGFSRVYLNVHWLSDVLAGFGLGLFWLMFLIFIFRVAVVGEKSGALVSKIRGKLL